MSVNDDQRLHQKKIALVLAGGGAKGAYQIGVQKALYDYGLRTFVTIAGTSVGALNAVLFDTAPPSKSRDVWMKMAGFADGKKKWRNSLTAWSMLLFWAGTPIVIFVAMLSAVAVLAVRFDDPHVATSHSPMTAGYLMAILAVFCLNQGATMIYGHQDRVFGHLMKLPKLADQVGVLPFALIGVLSAFFSVFLAVPGLLLFHNRYADVTTRFAILVCVWTLSKQFWRFYERIGIRLYERAMSSSLMDRTLLEDLIQERVDCFRNGSTGGARLFANVSRFSAFYDPNLPRYGSPNMPSLGDDGGLIEGWAPSYTSVTAANVDLIKDILLNSASLPFAFPNVYRQGISYCDGGATDNVPIAAVFLGEIPDLVFVVTLRKRRVPPTKQLFEEIDGMWRRYLKTIIDYPLNCELAEKNERFQAIFERTKPSRHSARTTIYFIQPSKPLPTIPFLFMSFFTGTLNFDGPTLEKWMKLGKEDTIDFLRNLEK